MSSGGIRTTHFKKAQMTIKSKEHQEITNPPLLIASVVGMLF